MTALFPEQFVIDKCGYFSDIALWPRTSELSPEGWLANFSNDDRHLALCLLNAFLYFSEEMVNQVFFSAFQALSRRFVLPDDSFVAIQRRWRTFVDSAWITYVTGQPPNPTDSGLAFARKARTVLEIPQDRISSPGVTAAKLLADGPRPVVLVDDFVGSGEQFTQTWHRSMDINGTSISLATLATRRGSQFFYCPAFCTEEGLQAINRDCRHVEVSPGHLIGHQYSATSPDSVIWPPGRAREGTQFLERVSRSVGISDWKGFGDLGLCVAFHDSVPDATLPIFHWQQNRWFPLVRRK